MIVSETYISIYVHRYTALCAGTASNRSGTKIDVFLCKIRFRFVGAIIYILITNSESSRFIHIIIEPRQRTKS